MDLARSARHPPASLADRLAAGSIRMLLMSVRGLKIGQAG